MNPVIFNCVLLYLTVIILSLVQSRFRLIKDDPWVYLIVVLITPFMILGKVKGVKTWTELTALEVFGYTLVIAMMNAKRILPKINEAYIFAYTLFHWYLLFDTIAIKGFNFWTILVVILSVFPTFLIVRSAFEHKALSKRNKIILYYWFLFTIIFTYIDQVALNIVTPILTLFSIDIKSTLIVLSSAVQVYFISTILSLAFIAVPVFHLERSSLPFKVRWKKAMDEWRTILNFKLDNYIEYQINTIQVIYIAGLSGVLFYIDAMENIRHTLIFIYTVVLPLVFFYLKWSPGNNLEEDSPVLTAGNKRMRS